MALDARPKPQVPFREVFSAGRPFSHFGGIDAVRPSTFLASLQRDGLGPLIRLAVAVARISGQKLD